MFKLTGNSGSRKSSGGGARVGRVSSTRMGHGRDLSTEQHRRPAFLPDTPQEQGFDSDGPRIGGLEKNLSGGKH